MVYVAAWNNKGWTLHKLHREEEALAACDRTIAIDPNAPEYWKNKANALRALGREDEAQVAERHAEELCG